MGAGAPVSPLSAGSLAQLTLSLLFIVGLIFAISWLLKRFRIAAPAGRGELIILDQVASGLYRNGLASPRNLKCQLQVRADRRPNLDVLV